MTLEHPDPRWQKFAQKELLRVTPSTRVLADALLERDHLPEPPSIVGDFLVARVRSSRGRTHYVVDGSFRRPLRCTCSWGGSCKHTAAVLTHLAESPPVERADVRRNDMSSVPHEVDQWLARIAPSSDLEVHERIAFLLTLDGQSSRIHLARQMRARSGEWRSLLRCSERQAQMVFASAIADGGVQRAIELVPWGQKARATLRGRIGGLALGALIDSRRLYYSMPEGNDVLLRRGPPIAASLSWKSTPNALFPSIQHEYESLRAVTLVPTYYVDEERATAGVFDAGIDDAMIARWLSGPPIRVAHADAVARALGERSALPLPPVIAVERIDVAPTAVLTLREWPAAYDSGLPRRAADLDFRYGEAIVPSASQDNPFSVSTKDKRVEIVRHVDDERRLARALGEAGFSFVASDWHTGSPDPLVGRYALFTEEDWVLFLGSGADVLRARGFEIVVDASFSLTIVEIDDWFTELQEKRAEDDGTDWFDVDFGVRVGDERVSLLPLLIQAFRLGRAPKEGQSLTIRLPSGSHALVPYERVAPLVDLLVELAAAPPSKTKPRISRLRAMDLATELRLTGETWSNLRALRASLAREARLPRARVPTAVEGVLRGYQRDGFSWLSFLGAHNLGAVLADDMGLGKTIQVIALIAASVQADPERPPSLVVAPTSVLISWTEQLARFTPRLRVVLWHGAGRWGERQNLANANIVLTTYTLLHRDRETLSADRWDIAVLDEAQAIKNPKSVYAEAARGLRSRQRLAITGTPLENHLGELWSIVSFAAPGALGDERGFRAAFRRPIEKDGDASRLATLRRRIAPLLLRRTKEEVATELPAKTLIEHKIELGDAQRDLYEAVRQMMDKRVRDEIAKRGFDRARIIVLDALLKLRQVACDPRLLKSETAKKRVASAKLGAFEALLETLLDEGRSVLVFSQFVEMLEFLADGLRKRRCAFSWLTGSTVDRAGEVGKFQRGDVRVFLISLKAGGVGLNLTAADTVIHYDPWWNPAVEAQATDRAHRIGQTKPVFVHRLVARGTIEEKIVLLQAKKAALARGLLEGGGAALQLDEALVSDLLAPIPLVDARRSRGA